MKNEANGLPPVGGLMIVVGQSQWLFSAGKPFPGDSPFDFGRLLVWTFCAVPLTQVFALSFVWLLARKKLLASKLGEVEEQPKQKPTQAALFKRCFIIVAVYQLVGVLSALFVRYVGTSGQLSHLSLTQFVVMASLCSFLSALVWLGWSAFCERKLRATRSATP